MPPSWTKTWVRSARFLPLAGVPLGAVSPGVSTLAELEADDDARLEDDALVEEVVGVGVEEVVGLRVVAGTGRGRQVEVARQVVVGLGAGGGGGAASVNSHSP